MAEARTAKHVATKLVTLLVSGDWHTKWEIVGVGEMSTGHQIVVRDPHDESEFVVTVQKRSTAPAIVAKVDAPAGVTDLGHVDEVTGLVSGPVIRDGDEPPF